MEPNIEPYLGFLVDTNKLRNIVFAPSVPPSLSAQVWDKLNERAIQPGGTDSFLLGLAMANLYLNAPTDALAQMMEECRDMNKLPLVSVRGQPVDGSKVNLGPSVIPTSLKEFLDG